MCVDFFNSHSTPLAWIFINFLMVHQGRGVECNGSMVLRVDGRSLPPYVQQRSSHGGTRQLLHDISTRVQHIHGHRQLPDSNNVYLWSQPRAFSHCSETLPGTDESDVQIIEITEQPITLFSEHLNNIGTYLPQWRSKKNTLFEADKKSESC